ncbi:MAG: hypothetical protein ACYDEP_02525 [Acidimicrobiales bacterium]
MITDIVVATDDLCSRVAHRHSRYAGLDWTRDADDLIELVREVELKMLNLIADGDERAMDFVPSWESAIFIRGRAVIRSYADSVAVTGISGYTGAKRRQRSLDQHRHLIESALHEPITVHDLIEDWNASVTSTRTNPRKQGAFAVEADVAAPIRVHPHAPDTLSTTQPDADSSLDHVEASDFVARTIAACRDESGQLGQIAAVYLGWYPDGEPSTPTEVAQTLGISVYLARKGIRRVKDVFQEIFQN